MRIEPKGRDLTQKKELKVQLPLTHHLALHQIRLLMGKNISETVREALELYFETELGMKPGLNGAFAGADAGEDEDS